MDKNKLTLTPKGDEKEFYKQVADLLAMARQHAKRQLDGTIVATYYEVGRMIVEREQQGQKRAQYGAKLIKGLSEYLTEQYGRGFSATNLKGIRNFYLIYAPSISQTASDLSKKSTSVISVFDDNQKGRTMSAQFMLSWSHYQILARIESEAARRFYEIEAVSQQWSVRQLQRQVGSSLYERLALSRDKEKVMALANEGQSVKNPRDIFKYNRLLQCYVLIDLKTSKLKHQDLGQMQMYVNYFDRYVKQDFEKPAVGILLCQEKNDNIVELTLPNDANIYASAYSLYLPDKALLQRKLAEWVEEFEEEHGGGAE